MDYNEFSFEALFNSCDFIRYDSPEWKKSVRELNDFLQSKFSDFDLCSDIESISNLCCTAAYNAGFEQGFRFAVKLMRRVYDMSFSEMPPVL